MKRKMLSMKSRTSLPCFVAEVFRHGDAGESDAQAHARRLVHLPEDERGLFEHARVLHLEPQIVALARAFADAGEDRVAAVLGGDVADQLLDEDGFADARAAEQSDLAAADVGRHEVDDLDAGLEHDRGRILFVDFGRCRGGSGCIALAATGLSESIALPSTLKIRPSVASPTGTVIGAPVSCTVGAAHHALGAAHRETADLIVAEFALDFERQLALVSHLSSAAR